MADLKESESPIILIDDSNDDLSIEVSDALYKQGKLEFVVKSVIKGTEYEVRRTHDEFEWLHDALKSNPAFFGLITPSKPQRPDLKSLQVQANALNVYEDMDENIKASEQVTMAQESTAVFRRAVLSHDIFMKKIAKNPKFATDSDLRVFLTYTSPLSIRGRNKRELLEDSFKAIVKTADEFHLTSAGQNSSSQVINSTDEPYYERMFAFLTEYYARSADAHRFAQLVAKDGANLCSSLKKLENCFDSLVAAESQFGQYFNATDKTPDITERLYGKACTAISSISLTEALSRNINQEDIEDWLYSIKQECRSGLDVLYKRIHYMSELEKANRLLYSIAQTPASTIATEKAELKRIKSRSKFEWISDDCKNNLDAFSKSFRLNGFYDQMEAFCKRQIDMCGREISMESASIVGQRTKISLSVHSP
ncbi:hypothetical protein ACOME3_010291 [Neoechinorhynchus agilis]